MDALFSSRCLPRARHCASRPGTDGDRRCPEYSCPGNLRGLGADDEAADTGTLPDPRDFHVPGQPGGDRQRGEPVSGHPDHGPGRVSLPLVRDARERPARARRLPRITPGMGLGSGQFRELQTGSILGRVGHSFEGRVKIWGSLLHRYRSNPLGYGPGNSRWQTVSVEERERPLASGTDPFLSKEAHNDYLAYLIERGPLALLALLVFKFQVFGRITRWWRGRAASAQGWVRGGPLAAATFGAWVASWINSNTIETLHFRHVWLFLALVYALGKVDGDARRTQPGELAGGISASAGPRAVGSG